MTKCVGHELYKCCHLNVARGRGWRACCAVEGRECNGWHAAEDFVNDHKDLQKEMSAGRLQSLSGTNVRGIDWALKQDDELVTDAGAVKEHLTIGDHIEVADKLAQGLILLQHDAIHRRPCVG